MNPKTESIPLPNLKIVLDTTEGLSQRGLANYLGIHESTVSRLINGKAKMLTPERIAAIEKYTGKTFEYLADLKAARLSEQEVSDMEALRDAPPEVQALIRNVLNPYRK